MSNRWYKGNLHTHTSLLGSTGPASPENVVRWYKQHGYDWLGITDHNVLTEYETDEMVMVRGQEVGKHMPSGNGPIHINGFGISRSVEFVDLEEKVPTMQANIDAVLAAGGMASLNHPNDRNSFTHEHVLQTTGASFIEVFNGGGPSKNNDGGNGRPSSEETWDGVLSGGQRLYGIATDDAHTYDEFRSDRANPGRGWVWVRACPLNRRDDPLGASSGRLLCVDRRRVGGPVGNVFGTVPRDTGQTGRVVPHKVRRKTRSSPVGAGRSTRPVRFRGRRGLRKGDGGVDRWWQGVGAASISWCRGVMLQPVKGLQADELAHQGDESCSLSKGFFNSTPSPEKSRTFLVTTVSL